MVSRAEGLGGHLLQLRAKRCGSPGEHQRLSPPVSDLMLVPHRGQPRRPDPSSVLCTLTPCLWARSASFCVTVLALLSLLSLSTFSVTRSPKILSGTFQKETIQRFKLYAVLGSAMNSTVPSPGRECRPCPACANERGTMRHSETEGDHAPTPSVAAGCRNCPALALGAAVSSSA